MADNLETSNIIVTDGQGNQQLAQATANQSGSMIWSDGIKTGWCVVQDGQGNKQLAMKVFDLNGGGGGVAENWASVLETMEDLSTTVNTKTTLDLADLLAMDIDGRPSHKEAGATVYSTSNNTIGIIDSVTSTQAVVTTVYVGGSGGSSIQVSTMPTASALLLNKIVEYVGATDENYHNAYFYKCVNTEGATATVTFNPAKISVSGTNFINFMKSVQPEAFVNVVSGTMTYYTAADLWAFDGKNADNEVIVHYQQYTDNWEAIGFTFTGTFTDEEVVNFTSTITVSYSWKQVNVQPQGDSLPSQTGHNGKYLKTDGTNASWASVDALPSQSGQSGKYLTTDGSSASWATVDLSSKQNVRTLVADTTSTTATIANIAGNTDYTFSQPLTALTITAVTANIMNEATLTFTASSSGCTVTLPASGLTQLGAPITLGTANCQYTISFWNNFYIVGIVEP